MIYEKLQNFFKKNHVTTGLAVWLEKGKDKGCHILISPMDIFDALAMVTVLITRICTVTNMDKNKFCDLVKANLQLAEADDDDSRAD